MDWRKVLWTRVDIATSTVNHLCRSSWKVFKEREGQMVKLLDENPPEPTEKF